MCIGMSELYKANPQLKAVIDQIQEFVSRASVVKLSSLKDTDKIYVIPFRRKVIDFFSYDAMVCSSVKRFKDDIVDKNGEKTYCGIYGKDEIILITDKITNEGITTAGGKFITSVFGEKIEIDIM